MGFCIKQHGKCGILDEANGNVVELNQPKMVNEWHGDGSILTSSHIKGRYIENMLGLPILVGTAEMIRTRVNSPVPKCLGVNSCCWISSRTVQYQSIPTAPESDQLWALWYPILGQNPAIDGMLYQPSKAIFRDPNELPLSPFPHSRDGCGCRNYFMDPLNWADARPSMGWTRNSRLSTMETIWSIPRFDDCVM